MTRQPFDLHGLKTYYLAGRPSKVFREDLGLLQFFKLLPDFAELNKDRPQLETDLESLLRCGLITRQRFEDAQRLLEPVAGILKRRVSGRPEASQPKIVHPLLAQLSAESVIREPLDVLTKSISM